ncbi:hypothetical protein VTK73DRAFT_6148 [Phialemonium thermophilum]|uniref:Clr5 domain-containing protein n=1 Tax=Phialemonium thermophilum TaxID=223376 RepID=A0ABR3WL13_9PEZI
MEFIQEIGSAPAGLLIPQSPLLWPSTPRDWEQQKDTIHNLYLQQNKRLKDVIQIMIEQHRFSATPRMYKRQFLKWKWTKYNVHGSRGAPPTGQAFRGSTEKSCRRLRPSKRTCEAARRRSAASADTCDTSSGSISPTTASPISGCTYYAPMPDRLSALRIRSHLAIRSYVEHYHRDDAWTRGSGSSRRERFSVDCSFWKPLALVDLALEKLSGPDYDVGGRLMRRIFRDVSQSLDGVCLETFFGLCIQTPVYMVRRWHLDLLCIYLRYVAGLGRVKFARHPLVAVVEMLRDLSTECPGATSTCLEVLSALWVDELVRLRGAIDIHVLSTRYQIRVVKQGPGHPCEDQQSTQYPSKAQNGCRHPETDQDARVADAQLVSDFGRLLREAEATRGVAESARSILEDQILHMQWRFDAYEADFEQRSRQTIARLEHKYWGSRLGYRAAWFDQWKSQDLLIYQRCHMRLLEFLFRYRRLQEAHAIADRAIEAADDRLLLRYAGFLEELLRWMGRIEDADAVKRRWAGLPLLSELEREDGEEFANAWMQGW